MKKKKRHRLSMGQRCLDSLDNSHAVPAERAGGMCFCNAMGFPTGFPRRVLMIPEKNSRMIPALWDGESWGPRP